MKQRLPWYDSSWLSRFLLAKAYIAANCPARLEAYVRALEPLRTRTDFRQQVLDNVFSDAQLATIRAAYKAIDPAMLEVHEIQRHGRFVVHDHPLLTGLHAAICPSVGEMVGEQVEPSYSFLAMYNRDGKCPPHLDQPVSKWTLDFCIEQSEPWPIWFSEVVAWPDAFAAGRDGWEERILSSPEHRFTAASLEPGQAVLFSGSSQWHYRDPFPDPGTRTNCSLLFLHFIPAGMKEAADWKNWERLFDVPGLTAALE